MAFNLMYGISFHPLSVQLSLKKDECNFGFIIFWISSQSLAQFFMWNTFELINWPIFQLWRQLRYNKPKTTHRGRWKFLANRVTRMFLLHLLMTSVMDCVSTQTLDRMELLVYFHNSSLQRANLAIFAAFPKIQEKDLRRLKKVRTKGEGLKR